MQLTKGTLLTWCVIDAASERSQRSSFLADHFFPLYLAVRSDAACKQLILQLDETRHNQFVIQDLDETHVLVDTKSVDELRALLEAEVRRRLTCGKPDGSPSQRARLTTRLLSLRPRSSRRIHGPWSSSESASGGNRKAVSRYLAQQQTTPFCCNCISYRRSHITPSQM